MIITEDIIYLATNVLYAYILCKFMRSFFGQRGNCRIKEVCSFIIYYCFISFVYLTYKDTSLTVVTNLISYSLLTLNYHAKIGYRIIGVVFIYATLSCAETISLLIVRLFGFSHYSILSPTEYIISQIFTGIIYYVIVLSFSSIKLSRDNYPVPFLYWIAIVTIPAGILFPILSITESFSSESTWKVLMSAVILFSINILVFFLYEQIMVLYAQLIEKKLLEQQNSAYQKQLEIITNSQQKFKIFRHDIRHHISILSKLIDKKEYEEARNYLRDIGEYLSTNQELVSTGNTAVDSIINYMAGVAKQKDIQLQCDMQIPEKLAIAAFDLNGIISNLLDNAIKVIERLPSDNKNIILMKMQYQRGLLYLTVENPYTETAQKEAAEIGHELGLQSVQMAADKYDGVVKFDTDQEIFRVEVLLYEKLK